VRRHVAPLVTNLLRVNSKKALSDSLKLSNLYFNMIYTESQQTRKAVLIFVVLSINIVFVTFVSLCECFSSFIASTCIQNHTTPLHFAYSSSLCFRKNISLLVQSPQKWPPLQILEREQKKLLLSKQVLKTTMKLTIWRDGSLETKRVLMITTRDSTGKPL